MTTVASHWCCYTSRQPPGRNQSPLARVVDVRLAADVARRAVAEADARAESIAQSDAVLGKVERAEAQRLRDVLAAVLPELFQPEGGASELLM